MIQWSLSISRRERRQTKNGCSATVAVVDVVKVEGGFGSYGACSAFSFVLRVRVGPGESGREAVAVVGKKKCNINCGARTVPKSLPFRRVGLVGLPPR